MCHYIKHLLGYGALNLLTLTGLALLLVYTWAQGFDTVSGKSRGVETGPVTTEKHMLLTCLSNRRWPLCNRQEAANFHKGRSTMVLYI